MSMCYRISSLGIAIALPLLQISDRLLLLSRHGDQVLYLHFQLFHPNSQVSIIRFLVFEPFVPRCCEFSPRHGVGAFCYV